MVLPKNQSRAIFTCASKTTKSTKMCVYVFFYLEEVPLLADPTQIRLLDEFLLLCLIFMLSLP